MVAQVKIMYVFVLCFEVANYSWFNPSLLNQTDKTNLFAFIMIPATSLYLYMLMVSPIPIPR
jgi:hypothetical protein